MGNGLQKAPAQKQDQQKTAAVPQHPKGRQTEPLFSAGSDKDEQDHVKESTVSSYCTLRRTNPGTKRRNEKVLLRATRTLLHLAQPCQPPAL